jgi:tetracycline repressor-like protein
LLDDGIRAGDFDIPDIKLTSTAILMMCSGVSDWFTRRGRLTADLVADDALAHGKLRVGQRPGPRNELGGIIFDGAQTLGSPLMRMLQRSRKFELACLVEQAEFELRCGLKALVRPPRGSTRSLGNYTTGSERHLGR